MPAENRVKKEERDKAAKMIAGFALTHGTAPAEEIQEIKDKDYLRLIRLGEVFEQFLQSVTELNEEFLSERHPQPAVNVRTYSLKALRLLKGAIDKVLMSGEKSYWMTQTRVYAAPLPAGLEPLMIELEEVNAGKKSTLFFPNAAEQNKVRLSVRAAAAAALDILVSDTYSHIASPIAPLDDAAELISKKLFALSIFRVDPETHKHVPIPPATIIDWRNTRKTHSKEFSNLRTRNLIFIGAQLALSDAKGTERIAQVLDSLQILIFMINFS